MTWKRPPSVLQFLPFSFLRIRACAFPVLLSSLLSDQTSFPLVYRRRYCHRACFLSSFVASAVDLTLYFLLLSLQSDFSCDHCAHVSPVAFADALRRDAFCVLLSVFHRDRDASSFSWRFNLKYKVHRFSMPLPNEVDQRCRHWLLSFFFLCRCFLQIFFDVNLESFEHLYDGEHLPAELLVCLLRKLLWTRGNLRRFQLCHNVGLLVSFLAGLT